MSASKDSGERAPRRKRVVLADRRGTREVPRTIMELEEQNSVGEAMVTHLMKAQLRGSLVLGGVTVAVFLALPLLFWSLPDFARATAFGIHLPWLILGVLPFPFMVLVGYLSVRWAERHEREFLHMVER